MTRSPGPRPGRLAFTAALAATAAACSREICIQTAGNSEWVDSDGAVAAGSTDGGGLQTGGSATKAAGTLSARLPARMLIGLEDNEGTWMGASGVNWDVRWAYFTGSGGSGWYNGWAGGALNGTWSKAWLQSVLNQRFIPAIHYFLLQGDYAPSGTTDDLVAGKLSSPSVMNDYFTKVRLLLQVAGQLDTPVILIIEGGTLDAIEQQAGNDPNRYAAIADSGLSELAGLPNSVAGFGQAFLELRKVVGATNVLLGLSLQPSGGSADPLGSAVTNELQPFVDGQDEFYHPFGVGPNATGDAFDFLATCPSWADADQAAAQGDALRWWDAADTASTETRSFNRYAAWLSKFNQTSRTRWILWQVPMGNSNSPNVYNRNGAWAGPYPTGVVLPAGCVEGSKTGCPGGYKDNRPEYFLGEGRDQHLGKFAAAGVVGLLFGSNDGASNQTDDYYTDGQLFLKSRADLLLRSGGFSLRP